MDKIYTNIKERCLYFSKNQDIKVVDFLKSIGMTYGSFKGEAKKGSLNSDAIAKIYTEYPHINLEWLITGEGDMLIHNSNTDNTIKEPIGTYANTLQKKYPLIPLDAMAGFGNGSNTIMHYDTEMYAVPDFDHLNVDFLIKVKGSSMYPKYNSGDVVACVKLPLDTFFQWNKVYVIDSIQGPMIKRVKKSNLKDHILLVSDNSSYDPFDLPISEIHSLALVVGVIRLE